MISKRRKCTSEFQLAEGSGNRAELPSNVEEINLNLVCNAKAKVTDHSCNWELVEQYYISSTFNWMNDAKIGIVCLYGIILKLNFAVI